MSGRTSIEWTDATWNPVRGCSRISDGCKNCYAEHQAARIIRMDRGAGRPEGTGAYDGLIKLTSQGPKWTGEIRTVQHVLNQPLRWTKPRRIFVNSMSDLFHEGVDSTFVEQVFEVMHRCADDNTYDATSGLWTRHPRHTFQILTKRASRMREFMQRQHDAGVAYADAFKKCPTPEMRDSPAARWARQAADPAWYSDIHLGISAENQPTANERIPELLKTPAARRFVSLEPLLAPIDLTPFLWGRNTVVDQVCQRCPRDADCACGYATRASQGLPALDWVIVGGESGPGARSMVLGWAKDIVRQCQAAGVPVFVKQLGKSPTNREGVPHPISDRKGSVMADWPEILRVQELPA